MGTMKRLFRGGWSRGSKRRGKDAMVGGIVLAAGAMAALVYQTASSGSASMGWFGVKQTANAPRGSEPAAPVHLKPAPVLSPAEVVMAALTPLGIQANSETWNGGTPPAAFLTARARESGVCDPIRHGDGCPAAALKGHLGLFACEPRILGGTARQIVRVQHLTSGMQAFEFVLRKRADGPWEGCWLIDEIVPRPDLAPPGLGCMDGPGMRP